MKFKQFVERFEASLNDTYPLEIAMDDLEETGFQDPKRLKEWFSSWAAPISMFQHELVNYYRSARRSDNSEVYAFAYYLGALARELAQYKRIAAEVNTSTVPGSIRHYFSTTSHRVSNVIESLKDRLGVDPLHPELKDLLGKILSYLTKTLPLLQKIAQNAQV